MCALGHSSVYEARVCALFKVHTLDMQKVGELYDGEYSDTGILERWLSYILERVQYLLRSTDIVFA